MLKREPIGFKLLAKQISPWVLLLTIHSVVVSGFHHHSIPQTPIVDRGTVLEANSTDQPGGAPSGGSDSSCVSCQLQRTFASEVRTPSVLALVPAEPFKRQVVALSPTLGQPATVLSDRAPPAA